MRLLYPLCIAIMLLLSAGIPAVAQSESYDDVMVIVNDSSWQSTEIAGYFASRRNIPAWHVCHIRVDTSETTDSLRFMSIKWQIESWMRSRNLTDSINYIVTTKGCPLRVNTAQWDDEINGPYGGQASFEDCIALMNGADSVYILTPKYVRRTSRYYGSTSRFRRNSTTMPLYLVTRLDAYTVDQAKGLVRAAESTVNPTEGTWVFDVDPWHVGGTFSILNSNMRRADSILRARGLDSRVDTTTAYVNSQSNVIGYASWGSNDYNVSTYAARPGNSWRNGSIAETYVSTSARSFQPNTPYGQSLIADLIAEGVSAVKGYTDEPYATSMASVDILIDRYTSGFTMAESFFAASRWAAWRQVVIGDPKMKLATPIISLAGAPIFCGGDSVLLTAPSGYARQRWSTGDTSRSIVVRQGETTA